MQALKTSLRIARFLGKVILGILLVLISSVAIVHLPPVQKQITRSVSNYLSSKINAKVNIQRIEFTLLGHIIIEGLTLWSPDEIKIVSIQKIEINSNLFDLMTGDLRFEEIRIVGLNGQLTENENGLNIQFILDAFQPMASQTPTQSSAINLQCKTIQLENIHFEFVSATNGISVVNEVGELIIQDVALSTNTILIIRAKNVSLQHSNVNIVSTTLPQKINNTYAPETDSISTNPSIKIEVKKVQVNESNFSFHQDTVLQTSKFDPTHIDLRKIEIKLTDILVGIQKDTVAATLHSLSAQLPGFKVDKATANELHWSNNHLATSDFYIISGTNKLNVDLKAMYDLPSAQERNPFSVDLDASGKITPRHFSYFLSDSIMQHFNHWTASNIKLKGEYHLNEGEIETLDLQTENSRLQAEGIIGNVMNVDNLHWRALSVNSTIGQDFKQTLSPFLSFLNLPENASVNLKSSETSKDIHVDGRVTSHWGNMNFRGNARLQADDFKIDLTLDGEQIDLGKWLTVSVIGPMDVSVNAQGSLGNHTNLAIDGSIHRIKMMDQDITNIDLQSKIGRSEAEVNLQLNDLKYKSNIQSNISFAGPVILTSDATLHNFKLGDILHTDTTFSVSGNLKSQIKIESSTIEMRVEGDTIAFQNKSTHYSLDTLSFQTLLSTSKSNFNYYSDHEKANLEADFDITDSPEVFLAQFDNILKGNPLGSSDKNRNFEFNLELKNNKLFQLLNIDINDFSSLNLKGEWNEQHQTSLLQVKAENLKAYGTSLDSLNAKLTVQHDSVEAFLNAKNLVYNSIALGQLNFNILSKGDTAISNFQLANDTLTILDLRTKILPTDSGAFFFSDKVVALDKNYNIDRHNPIYIDNKNVVLNNFQIGQDDMLINLDGNLNTFNASLKDVNLTPLNFLLSPDTTVIQKGRLNGVISYSPKEKYLNLKAKIDSLSLYNSDLLTVEAKAESNGNNNAPFDFLLTNASNEIEVKGDYTIDNTQLDATLRMNINHPEIFSFLISDIVDKIHGNIEGEAKIAGPIQKPILKGAIQFQNVEVTTANPKFTFNVKDDQIALDSSSLFFNHFTVFDQEDHPLVVDGNINTKDYQSFTYNLQLKAQGYTLMNKPDSASGQLKGSLVIDSDIKLKGNEKDTNVEAKLTIKDKTHLIFVSSTNDIELLKADGIVEFIDPSIALDTALHQSASYYDSLIASLPDFNLNSTVKIEDNAKLTIVIDSQSGDYMETTGGASLELAYDRLGNIHLVGDYTMKQGVYRLSFYDLVKRNFTLVPHSSIHWSGNPENGDLNIKAIHTVESNSIGLIGHEIGENEKSIYKRSLDYEVGIIIDGTLDKPIVSFSLDLPEREKANYPVLANKLDRLKQPEYQSELNKQVFGLLVLGGFIPETSGSDINSSQIATTALSNSVNSLLANQLNKFASQYIKGVNIDVGIQSYSDYSAPGGKTQTAMDFRVSKRILDDRLSFEVGGDFDINQDQSGANTGSKNYRGDIAIIYDLTGNGDKQLKLFNNETYDIVYQEIRNTGISIIFIREFSEEEKKKRKKK